MTVRSASGSTRSGRDWTVKLARYGLTGGLAAVVDLGGFVVLLACGIPTAVAATLSFLAATVINYLLSARFAFRATISAKGYLRFLWVAGLGLVINVAVTMLAHAAGLPPVMAKLAGIAVAFGANFLLNLILVFPRDGR